VRLNSTKLVTRDVPALAQFYATVTGLVPVGIEDYVELETATGILAISSQRGTDTFYAGAAEPAANRSLILDFEVADVDRERVRLGRLAVECVLEPTDQPWGSRTLLFRDPDGNLISFTAPLPGARPLQPAKTMKKPTTVHWIVTGAISSFMLFSAYYSGSHPVEFGQMGFPNYFRIELTVAKIIGALLLLVPAVPVRVREWIYACFGVVLVSAFIAKLNSGYPLSGLVEPLSVLALMAGALAYLDKVNRAAAHNPLGAAR